MVILFYMVSSIFLRSIIAIAVSIGFYLLSILLAVSMLNVAYHIFLFMQAHTRAFLVSLSLTGIVLSVAFACVLIPIIIVWSIFPRYHRFSPPGLRINSGEQALLFDTINDVARKTSQKAPKEIYFVPDMNAAVREIGGFMGIGGRRVLVIGLPLFQILTVSEYRAVLAHEFGHYYYKDTKLSPWIYTTRAAIERTLKNLDKGMTHFLFRLYGRIYLRITFAISRYQEYVADELAARTEGPIAGISAIRKIHTASIVHEAFWNNEMLPALRAGYLPPYLVGFGYYLTSDCGQTITPEGNNEDHPYDTHPSMNERIRALETYPNTVKEDESPAINLITNLPLLEKHLFDSSNLEVINWNEVGECVYLPMWVNWVTTYRKALVGLRMEDIPDIAREPDEFAQKISLINNDPTLETALRRIRVVIGSAIAAKLAQLGWKIIALPGEAVKLVNQEHEFEPFNFINRLFNKDISRLDWRLICQSMGIYEVALILDEKNSSEYRSAAQSAP